ncbi:MAG: diguanylate cyclase [Solirubrobacteraceae bacterium]
MPRLRANPILTTAIAAMAIGLAFEAAQAITGIGGTSLQSVADKDVYTGLEFLAVAVLVARVLRGGADRLAWGLMAAGLLAWTAGDLIWTLWLDGVANPPYPSLADVFYLAMFPLASVALALLIRARLRRAGAAQWLDGGVVGLTAAAGAAALVLDSVVRSGSSRWLADAVNLIYPVGDFVLLIFVAVACSLSGWRPGRGWLTLGMAVILAATADLVFAYQTASGAYQVGTLLDVMWPASMCLFALAAWVPARYQPLEPASEALHTILITLGAAICALAMLVWAAFAHVTPVAIGLAAAALVLASLRAALTYLANLRMLRRSARDALTDPLSGLGNRPALMNELQQVAATRPVATLLFFDLNGFKRYNDSFGHAAGDVLLGRLATALTHAVEEHGRAYRLGGDEFCVLLHGRFQRHDPVVTAAAAALLEQGRAFTVSASLGMAVLPDDAATASAALQLANERMYADKAGEPGAARAQARDVLMQLLSERTPGLHHHVTSVRSLASMVGTDLGLDSEQIDELLRAAELHDIGKLAVPDQILDKPGPLSEPEWRFMREHPAIGERILNAAPALRPVARLVRASHERWDGGGYPDGLAGDKIPLGARIVAVCDAFEAMTCDRCYQHARNQEDALAELRRHAGTQFDPAVVAAIGRALDAAAEPPTQRGDEVQTR